MSRRGRCRLSVTKSALPHLLDEEVERKNWISDSFHLYDNNTGILDEGAFVNAITALGLPTSRPEVTELYNTMGKQWGDPVNFEEFSATVTGILANVDPREEMTRVFRVMDIGGTGRVTLDNLRVCCAEAGITITEGRIFQLMRAATRDDSGEIDLDGFLTFILRARNAVTIQRPRSPRDAATSASTHAMSDNDQEPGPQS